MKKRFLFASIISLFTFTLTGCKTHIALKNQEPTIESVSKIGKAFKNYDLSFNDVTYKNMMDEALSDLKGATSYEDAYNAIEKALIKTHELINKYYVASALYDYNQDVEEIKEQKELLSDAYYEYESFRANLIYELKDNMDILRQLLPGFSDEDIEYEINQSEKKKEEKYTNLQKEIDDITDEFNNLDFDLYDNSNNSQILELLYRFVNKNKELSEYLGFDSYTEYKDVMYSRIYTKDDVNDFISNVKEYILPIDFDSFANKIRSKVARISYPEYAYLVEFEETSIFDGDYKTKRLANDYAKKIGGNYYKTYSDYNNKGYYVFSNEENCLTGAYTNDCLSYFGKGYQDVSTFIHEFGHYYSFTNGDVLEKSLDLKEFYSQANEFLFLSYLEQYSDSYLKDVYDIESSIKLIDSCNTLIIGSAFREYEEKIYTSTISTPTDLYDIWNNLNSNEYNMQLDDYWKIEIRYDVYYLSYATSLTGALSLYSYSQNNFSNAALAYMNAACNSNMDYDIVEVLTKNHLDDPFSEEAFIHILNLVEEKSK